MTTLLAPHAPVEGRTAPRKCRRCDRPATAEPGRLCRCCAAEQAARERLDAIVDWEDETLIEQTADWLELLLANRLMFLDPRCTEIIDEGIAEARRLYLAPYHRPARAVRVVRDPVIRPLDDDEPEYPF